jgi:hypothetical protein
MNPVHFDTAGVYGPYLNEELGIGFVPFSPSGKAGRSRQEMPRIARLMNRAHNSIPFHRLKKVSGTAIVKSWY